MRLHHFAITAMIGVASATKSTTKQRKAFLNDMKSANLKLHPSERSLTKDQTPSIETFGEIINGDSSRSISYREKIMKRAKFVSPEEIKARDATHGGRNLAGNDANTNSYVTSDSFQGAYGFDVTDYSFSYLRCAEVRQFDDELAAIEDSPSVFSTKHFAVFRFCPTTTCEGMSQDQLQTERVGNYSDGNTYGMNSRFYDNKINGGADGSGCSSNYGEYMLELEDYLAIMLEYHQDRFEAYCDYCDDCMYKVYQNWLQQNNRDLKEKTINENWQEDFDRHLSAADKRELGDIYSTCPEYDTCKYYKDTCGYETDDSLTQYFECTEVNGNNGMVAYIGPHCAEDGKSVTLGLYSDENCNEYIGGSNNITNFLGFDLEAEALDKYFMGSVEQENLPDKYFQQYNPQEQMCIPCSASLQMYEEEYNDEVNDLCINMYLASARCDKHYKSYKSPKSYYGNQDLSCKFIQSVVQGNYNEMGFVNLQYNNLGENNGNILTSSTYYQEYEHYAQEVSPLQIFGLIASISACAILFLYATFLGRTTANSKVPWRPRRGIRAGAALTADPMVRNDSGIALNRSESIDRGRSTSSYYMY